MRTKTVLLLVLVALVGGIALPVQAQSEPEIEVFPPTYTFGERIVFQARLNTGASPEEILLIMEAPGQDTFIGKAEYIPPDQVAYIYDLTNRPLRVFAILRYHFRITLENGDRFQSDEHTFRYVDNREEWEPLNRADFEVFWYQREIDFGQEMLDTARDAQEKFATWFGDVPLEKPIEIYAYPNAQELQYALSVAGQTWIAGHADPEWGVIVVSIPTGDEQSREIRRQIPHEVAHVLLYQQLGDRYENLPVWLNEGIASQMEFYPNPDYQLYLEKAQQEHSLIPFSQLCRSFPQEAASSFLAYAQANSLVGYVKDQYGDQKLQDLVTAYASGVDCSRGTEIALGVSLEQLEKRWREATFEKGSTSFDFSEGILGETAASFLPWLLMFGLVIVPLLGIMVFRILSSSTKEGDA
jgi:hypothetical protein